LDSLQPLLLTFIIHLSCVSVTNTCVITVELVQIAQAVSLQFITAEAQVRSQASSCEICGEQIGTGTGFYLSALVLHSV
jgi:hypothetical protein